MTYEQAQELLAKIDAVNVSLQGFVPYLNVSLLVLLGLFFYAVVRTIRH